MARIHRALRGLLLVALAGPACREDAAKDGAALQPIRPQPTVPVQAESPAAAELGTDHEYRVLPHEGRTPTLSDAQAIAQTLAQRLVRTGVSGATVAAASRERVLVRLPADASPRLDELRELLRRRGDVEFRVVFLEPQDAEGIELGDLDSLPGVRFVPDAECPASSWVVEFPEFVRGADHRPFQEIDIASVEPIEIGLQRALSVELDESRIAEFGDFTRRNLGRQLAIVVEGQVYSAPWIESRVEGEFVIREPVPPTAAGLRILAATLGLPRLPFPIEEIPADAK